VNSIFLREGMSNMYGMNSGGRFSKQILFHIEASEAILIKFTLVEKLCPRTFNNRSFAVFLMDRALVG